MHHNSANIDKQLEHFLFNTFMLKSSDIIMITDGETDFTKARILGVNSSFEFITGLSQKDLIDSPCSEWINTSDSQLLSLNSAFKTSSAVLEQLAIKNNEGDLTQIQFEIYPVQQETKLWIWQAKLLIPSQLIVRNKQLKQQDMMQALEKTAGQTAHDFNNILAIIMCNNDLLLEIIEDSSPYYPLLYSISRAVDKGTHLTRSLMVFAQKNILNNEEFNLNDCLSSMANGLQENIEAYHILKLELCDQPCNVYVDRVMLEECISNLVLNASQAMFESPSGKSTIFIDIKKVFIPQQKDAFEQLILPQEYVKITITDTGAGITSTNLPLIFTPFFTTRKINAAKGVGLSMVYGFLKRSAGYCLVNTEVGKGSSFSLLFDIS
jgi:two-component system cell cycle sensor histidine kinase/response regulator CckA